MSISDQITRLQNAKANIKTSIENKGVTVPNDTKLDGYPALIDSIEAGGSSETHVNPDFYELRTQNGTNFDYLFKGYNGPDIDVSKWDTSKVTSAQYCFADCKKSMNISNWDLSSVTDTTYMFQNFTNGDKYIDLFPLNFYNVTNAMYMFEYSNTNYLDVSNLHFPSLTGYDYLFESCNGYKLNLSNWNISNVINLYATFYWSSFVEIDLTNWNTVNIENMEQTFYCASSMEKLIIPDWDMTNTMYYGDFLYENTNLKYIDLSRSNDLTINIIASMLPSTAGTMVIPANTSQEAIDAVTAKGWTTTTEPTQ